MTHHVEKLESCQPTYNHSSQTTSKPIKSRCCTRGACEPLPCPGITQRHDPARLPSLLLIDHTCVVILLSYITNSGCTLARQHHCHPSVDGMTPVLPTRAVTLLCKARCCGNGRKPRWLVCMVASISDHCVPASTVSRSQVTEIHPRVHVHSPLSASSDGCCRQTPTAETDECE